MRLSYSIVFGLAYTVLLAFFSAVAIAMVYFLGKIVEFIASFLGTDVMILLMLFLGVWFFSTAAFYFGE